MVAAVQPGDVFMNCIVQQGEEGVIWSRIRKKIKMDLQVLTLQEGGVEGLGGGLDGSSALGETRDVAKGVHG